MTIEKKIENGNVTLTITGRLDTATAPELEKTTEFLKLSMGTAEKAQRQAKHLFRTYEKVKEECE